MRGSAATLLVCAALLGPGSAAALTFGATYADNAAGDFARRGWLDPASSFQGNIRAALAIWGAAIDSDARLSLRVEADNAVARTGGTFSNGRPLGRDAAGNAIYEPGPLSVVLAGANPGGPTDLFLRVNAAFVEAHYWFDPTPDDRADEKPPRGRSDFVSIVLHEIGHALGVGGTRSLAAGPGYGTFPRFVNPFDVLSHFGGDGKPFGPPATPNPMFFSGAAAAALFGSHVPLAHVGPNHRRSAQDFYHLGTCGEPRVLAASLMNGCSVPVGPAPRMGITPLDKAVMRDLGYRVRR